MHPIERLRFVARAGGTDPAELALEAADALAGLGREPRALLTACRRLLAAHPECGPLWWLSARLLSAGDPGAAAAEAAEVLASHEAGEELAAALPSGAVVVTRATPLVLDGLSLRPDIEARLVDVPSQLRVGLRLLARELASVGGYEPGEAAQALEGATVVVVEALAAGPSGVLAAPGGDELPALAAAAGRPCWAVVPPARILPAPLFANCRERSVTAGRAEWIPVEILEAVVLADGLSSTAALRSPECPSVPELTSAAI